MRQTQWTYSLWKYPAIGRCSLLFDWKVVMSCFSRSCNDFGTPCIQPINQQLQTFAVLNLYGRRFLVASTQKQQQIFMNSEVLMHISVSLYCKTPYWLGQKLRVKRISIQAQVEAGWRAATNGSWSKTKSNRSTDGTILQVWRTDQRGANGGQTVGVGSEGWSAYRNSCQHICKRRKKWEGRRHFEKSAVLLYFRLLKAEWKTRDVLF